VTSGVFFEIMIDEQRNNARDLEVFGRKPDEAVERSDIRVIQVFQMIQDGDFADKALGMSYGTRTSPTGIRIAHL
jgi:hypothetical protein